MIFTINRYLFAAMFALIGLDILAERLTTWLMPMHWAGKSADLPSLLLALGYFAASFGVLIFFRSGPAVEFWTKALKANPKVKVGLSAIISIVQIFLWWQVISVIKSGHSSGLDASELNALQLVQNTFPFVVVLAVPVALLLNKLKNHLLIEMLKKDSEIILENECTQKVKRFNRPKLRPVQMRKCG